MIPPVWVVMPAAGIGRRMQSDIPKQYLTLLGRPVMHWGLDVLLSHPAVHGAVVALGAEDPWWPRTQPSLRKPLSVVRGGAERFESVFNALGFLLETADVASWVMVHDAVRPCVTREEIDRLLKLGMGSPDGALLASPVRDTLKRGNADGQVMSTENRDGLWHALTPQLFPLQTLHGALSGVMADGRVVTDEAQAMEYAGFRPLMVEGRSTNLKITRPADLPLAESILRAQYPDTEAEHVPDRTGV
ncbi:MAG: 2-C-methyl-D-erythritol 4-phosphate cytidylyltransferase [Aquisalimonadaceae bacterium]